MAKKSDTTTKTRKRRGRGEGSIFQRADGRWVASMSAGYGSDGKRQRHTAYGVTKKEAQDELAKLLNKSLNGTLSRPSKLTVGQFLDRWLEDAARPSVRPGTHANYKIMVERHIKPHVGGVVLSKLTPAHVQGLHAQLERDGKSPRLRQLVHAVLRRAVGQADRWGMIPRNVCLLVSAPRVERKTMQVLDSADVAKLLKAAKDDRLHALYVLAVTTGMRQGELLGLQWSDVDLKGGSVSVRHTLGWTGATYSLREPKSESGSRRIDLPKMAIDALHAHRKRMLAEGHAGSPWVFCDHLGGPLRKENVVRRSFQPLLKAAGVPAIRFHDLRHTAATLLLSAGEHPKVVQERLGHSQVSMTLDTYSHVLPTMQQKAAAKLDRLLGGAAG